MDLCRYKPHIAMTLSQLCLAIFLIMMQSLFSKGTSALVMVVYQHVISTVVLSALAFFIEKEGRHGLSFQILRYAFLLGFLQITLCQMLLTLSLQFTSATFQSIATNMVPMLVFVLAVVFGQEKFLFLSIHGQAKLWGVLVSTLGAIIMLVWKGSVLLEGTASASFKATRNEVIGCSLLVVATLAAASWNILVGHVSKMYPATLSLSALTSFFGTIQTAVITAVTETRTAWKLQWEGGLVLFGILYGGITVTGLLYYIRTWCIHKKGPVFPGAFTPLLIAFSFLLDTILLGNPTHLGSVIGAVLVVVGLYLLLWGKAKDKYMEDIMDEASTKAPLLKV